MALAVNRWTVLISRAGIGGPALALAGGRRAAGAHGRSLLSRRRARLPGCAPPGDWCDKLHID